jgi:hypothetical protein
MLDAGAEVPTRSWLESLSSKPRTEPGRHEARSRHGDAERVLTAGSKGRRFILAVLACVLLAALLRPFPAQFKFRHGGDCVRYLTWSHALYDKGVQSYPDLVVEYRQRWVGFCSPLRWAWLLAIDGVMHLWKAPADEYHPMVLLSWLGGVLALVPLAVWLRRLVRPELTLLALLLVATSPVARAMSHFPLPDSLNSFFCLWLLALAGERLAAPKRWHLGALATLVVLVAATRETSVLIVVAVAAVFFARRLAGERVDRSAIWALFVGGVVWVLLSMMLAGGPTALALFTYDVVRGVIHTGNSAFIGGPYYRYFVDFMIVSPVVVITVIASVGALLRTRELHPLLIQVGTVTLIVLALFCPLAKTLRYVLVVDVGLRALSVGAVWILYAHVRRRGRLLAAALVICLFAHDEFVFQRLWANDNVYDAVTWEIARGLGMIPR